MSGFGANYFGVMDYILLGSTLLTSLLIGIYHGFKGNQTNEDLLVGNREMKVFPIAASMMVTYVSAITIIGLPSEVYGYGSQIMVMHLVSAVGYFASAFVFIPFFYEMKLTSVNSYLERRFESRWVRYLASAIFILQTVIESGVVLYAPSIALETFLGFPTWMSIFGIGICATVYTNVGGLKAVVWTDALQFLVMIGGMLAILWQGFGASGGPMKALQLADERGRLKFFDFTFDPFTRHNFWNFLIGMGLHSFTQPGIHQLRVQRYSGMPTLAKAKCALIWSIPMKLLNTTLCLLTGIAIFAYYANCDPLSNKKIEKVDQILPYFVVSELAIVPGMMGIFTACIFSAALSSISSYVNSLAAVTWEDFLSNLEFFKNLKPSSQANVTRFIGTMYGFFCIGLAFAAQYFGSIYQASLAILLATAGGLYGLFWMAMFMPFVNATGAFIGTVCGFGAMMTVSLVALLDNAKRPLLPLSTEECAIEASPVPVNSTMSAVQNAPISFVEWPWKLFTLSYMLYPTVGASIAITVGLIATALANILAPQWRRTPEAKLIHPIARRLLKSFGATGSWIVSSPSTIEEVSTKDHATRAQGELELKEM